MNEAVVKVKGRQVGSWAVENLEKVSQGSEARVALERLSARELEVFWMEVDGRERKDMASSLGVSCKTVAVHVFNMRAKLGVKTVGEFLVKVAWWGLVS
jgi:DNA-binding NarL/FixJ family response regulator